MALVRNMLALDTAVVINESLDVVIELLVDAVVSVVELGAGSVVDSVGSMQ
jgi:hypothetical protein